MALATTIVAVDQAVGRDVSRRLELDFHAGEEESWGAFMKDRGWERVLGSLFSSGRETGAGPDAPIYARPDIEPRRLVELHATFADLEIAADAFFEAEPTPRPFLGLDADGRLFRIERAAQTVVLRVFEDEDAHAAYVAGSRDNAAYHHLRVRRVHEGGVAREDRAHLRVCGLQPSLHGVVRGLRVVRDGMTLPPSADALDAMISACVWGARTMRTFARRQVA